MKGFQRNWPLAAGLILYAITCLMTRYVDIPEIAHYALMLSAIALEFWGIIRIVRSPEMQSSRLRHWKMRLLGRGTK